MAAYLVLDFSIQNFPMFSEYIEKAPEFIRKHGGKYIVQGAEPTPIEGDWRPERMVILEFPNRDAAKGFLSDPDFQDILKVRHESTISKLVLVDGAS